ncbi:MAG: hypothetical protein HYV16_16400 [Gammaproteobacteria bacterium]|nr:hypothetical protein [Gammaproteobacteria bacterium]
MSQEQLKHLNLADGDLLRLPTSTSPEAMRQLADALTTLHPGKRILLFAGEVEAVPEGVMNQAGWFRQPRPTLH